MRVAYYIFHIFLAKNSGDKDLNGTTKKFKYQNRDILKFKGQNRPWVLVVLGSSISTLNLFKK